MCSYCGCRAITVIADLTRDHEAAVNLLGDVSRAAASGDAAAASARAGELAALLAPHTRDEEVGLFAELRREPELAEHVDSLAAEHDAIDALVERVVRGDLAAAAPLELLLRRHIDKEENGLFPAAVIALDGPRWDAVVEATA
jgi:hypothetical protein